MPSRASSSSSSAAVARPWSHRPLTRAALALLAAGALGPGGVAVAVAAGASATAGAQPASSVAPTAVGAVAAQRWRGAATSVHEGVVEAVRQTVVASQVPGAIVALAVKAGDRVAAGQVLARIDARSAEQGALASQAQVAAAQAQVGVAASELERKRQLFAKNYIARAALDQAEAAHAAALAQLRAAQAQAGAAGTQTGLHVIRAPYAGVVVSLQAQQGEMAMPGRPLLTLVDPARLRVVAGVPVSVLARLGVAPDTALVRLDVPVLGDAGRALVPVRVERLPTVDATSLTQTVRAELAPSDARRVAPGQFARLVLQAPPDHAAGAATPDAAPDAAAARAGAVAATKVGAVPDAAEPAPIVVPASAVVRRSELTAVYVVGPQGAPLLRQVRLGRRDGDRIEILAGLDAGERVLADPSKATPR